MDAFYASVEQRDNPELQGKPVIVGGDPQGRGVVAACSYEARKFGIHSAMPCRHAYQLCPEAVFLYPRFEAYQEVSTQIHEIFHEYTDLVEPLSLDEAYLDVTTNKKDLEYATEIAKEIKQKIKEKTGLTASAGVSYNKFLAKIASDLNKPDGIAIITPDQAIAFIETLPVRKFFGVGKVTEKKMNGLGIFTGADLKRWDREDLQKEFGKAGPYYYDIVRGVDDRPVESEWERKSVGREETFAEDILDVEKIHFELEKLVEDTVHTLNNLKKRGRTVTLKVRYSNFKTITRSMSLDASTNDKKQIMDIVDLLLPKTEIGSRKVRLVGVSLSNLELNE